MVPVSKRIPSIDQFRALTMFLMVWVNDFWSLRAIPRWLGHATGMEDRLGFSDVIFPAFLFIVGLSIPFSVSQRFAKGDDLFKVLLHIAERTFALLLMGVFLVNLENINADRLLIPVWLWQVLLIVSFLLIWNKYPKDFRFANWLKTGGWVLLLLLAVIFKGGATGHTVWIKTYWWGILGLIGWSYVICAVIYALFSSRTTILILCWLGFVLINIISFTELPEWLSVIRRFIWPVSKGSLPAMTMAGVVASVVLRSHHFSSRERRFFVLVLLGLCCLLAGIGLRPLEGISKIRATPAWTLICTGISFVVFALLYYFERQKGEPVWARLLKPAGLATLTCYLIPYLVYPLASLTGIALPDILLTGWIGLLKPMVFSGLVVWLTAVFVRLGVQLKV